MGETNFFNELNLDGLYLHRALLRVGDRAKANNIGFLKSREKLAADAYEKAKKAGHCIFLCREAARKALISGLNLNIANGG